MLIGALAARLQGFPRLTADADVAPAPDEAADRPEDLQDAAVLSAMIRRKA